MTAKPRDVIVVLLAFLLFSFLCKALAIVALGTLLTNLTTASSMVPILLPVAVAIVLTGLAVGKLVNTIVHSHPLQLGLIVGALAGIFRAIRPDIDPLPFFMVWLFSLLNFVAIVFGVHATARR